MCISHWLQVDVSGLGTKLGRHSSVLFTCDRILDNLIGLYFIVYVQFSFLFVKSRLLKGALHVKYFVTLFCCEKNV